MKALLLTILLTVISSSASACLEISGLTGLSFMVGQWQEDKLSNPITICSLPGNKNGVTVYFAGIDGSAGISCYADTGELGGFMVVCYHSKVVETYTMSTDGTAYYTKAVPESMFAGVRAMVGVWKDVN